MPRKKQKLIQAPRGMHDVLHPEYEYVQYIDSAFESIARFYGFLPIQTPYIEKSELFERAAGEVSDIVEKQMYSVKSQGKERLTLRPEGTAGVARAYIENGMVSWPQPVRLFYSGSFFRHESPQRGRLREFRSVGIETLGESDAVMDALTIRTCAALFEDLKLPNALVHINSIGDKECRPKYRIALLEYYRKHRKDLCKDCTRRIKKNPLRLLDCKEPSCLSIAQAAPNILDYLCGACKAHFRSVLEYLDEAGIGYVLVPTLVRGLDYYTRTVFEFVSEETAQLDSDGNLDGHNTAVAALSLAGGGRYDELVEMLGGKRTPGVGMQVGVDRVLLEMKRLNIHPPKISQTQFYLVQLGDEAKRKAFVLIEQLRKAGITVREGLSRHSLKTQFRIASNLKVPYVLLLGQKEAMDRTIVIKDMKLGSQEIVPLENISKVLQGKKYKQ